MGWPSRNKTLNRGGKHKSKKSMGTIPECSSDQFLVSIKVMGLDRAISLKLIVESRKPSGKATTTECWRAELYATHCRPSQLCSCTKDISGPPEP